MPRRDEKPTPGGNPIGAVTGNAKAPLALDRVIHERVRLAIVSSLAAHPRLTFTELKGLLKVSDGNLSVHARKLEEAGYLRCRKSFAGRVPKTEYELTPQGRRAFEQYLAHMEAVIEAAKGGK